MLITIPRVLTPEEIRSIRAALDGAPFVDGKLTAGFAAGRVKRNLELERESELRARLAQQVMGRLLGNELFQAAALPYRASTPIFARYVPGMFYGDHVDDPVMGTFGQRYRSDVSLTVFLNDPDAYEGGELVIRTPFGDQQVKLPAGDVVVYPSSSIHRVAEVTRGERLVMITWLQSMVRDPARRELLWELSRARETLLREALQADHTGQVDRSYVNLLRMWSEV
jgi:PKHD-type hydroxylase